MFHAVRAAATLLVEVGEPDLLIGLADWAEPMLRPAGADVWQPAVPSAVTAANKVRQQQSTPPPALAPPVASRSAGAAANRGVSADAPGVLRVVTATGRASSSGAGAGAATTAAAVPWGLAAAKALEGLGVKLASKDSGNHAHSAGSRPTAADVVAEAGAGMAAGGETSAQVMVARTRGVLDWVRAAALEAAGRHEQATAAHLVALGDTDRAGPACSRAAATRMLHAYAAVADWAGELRTTLHETKPWTTKLQ